MKIRFALAALSTALLFASSPALAGSWTGCYVGLQGGYAIADHDVSVPGLVSLDGISGEGFQGGPTAGCDLQFDRFVVGAFADYSFRNVDTSASLFGASATVGFEDAWSVGGRAGVLLTPDTLVYGLAAYQHTEVNDLGTGLLSDLDGWAGGAGIEVGFSPGWSLRGEYRYVAYEDAKIGGFVDLDSSEHQARIGLNYRFWTTDTQSVLAPLQP